MQGLITIKEIGDNDKKKMMILAVMMVMTIHNMANHNMGNHNNAHKTPNREVAMNTRTNRSGSGHFGGRR